jgi:hypothetical protein
MKLFKILQGLWNEPTYWCDLISQKLFLIVSSVAMFMTLQTLIALVYWTKTIVIEIWAIDLISDLFNIGGFLEESLLLLILVEYIQWIITLTYRRDNL